MQNYFRQLLTGLAVAALALPAIAQPGQDGERRKPSAGKILIVVTNHGRMGEEPNAKPTGYWLSEVSHPWAEFTDASYDIDFASPKGGIAPVDPRSFDIEKDPANKRMWGTRRVVEQLADTMPLAEVKPTQYQAIYFAGGHGTMWDFPESPAVQDAISKFWEQGKIVSAVCHGPAALVNAKTGDGQSLVKGKKVAAFTDSEENATGLQDVVPFLLESKLKEQGATVETAPNYQEKVVVDGNLITGQNPASAGGVAKEVLKALKAIPGTEDKSTTGTDN